MQLLRRPIHQLDIRTLKISSYEDQQLPIPVALSLHTFVCVEGCDNDSFGEPFGTDTERYDIPLDTKSIEVNARGQKFAFNFYKEMAGKEESNFCISPLSASFCLGMVLNGANGNTYTELQEALGYEA